MLVQKGDLKTKSHLNLNKRRVISIHKWILNTERSVEDVKDVD